MIRSLLVQFRLRRRLRLVKTYTHEPARRSLPVMMYIAIWVCVSAGALGLLWVLHNIRVLVVTL